MQELLLVGLDHFTAPVEVRGQFAFTDTRRLAFASGLLELGAAEVVVLSTCNRSLVCLTGPEPERLLETARQYYIDFFNGAAHAACVTTGRGRAAIEELLRITCGLRSVVVGEDQILGQVRQAHAFAQQTGACGKILNKIFREAVTLAKQVKTELKISQIPLSVSYIGVKQLAQAMGGLAGKRLLLTGLGKMNRLALEYVMESQPAQVWLCTRTRCKAEEAVRDCPGCTVIDFDRRYAVLPQADAVITATSSPHTIFTADRMPPLDRPLYFLDMAVPRDTDAALSRLPGVHVLDVDDLQRVSQENLSRRLALAGRAEAMIQTRADALEQWLSGVPADPTIHSLQARCREITRDTTDILFARIDFTQREKKLVEKMVSSALERLIREPVLHLRRMREAGEQAAYIQVIEELFDLRGASHEDQDRFPGQRVGADPDEAGDRRRLGGPSGADI